MSKNQIFGTIATSFLILFAAQYSAFWVATYRPNIVSKFNLSSDRIAKDLDGRTVNLMLNQVWPFDSTQNITVQVDGKKQIDEFVVVIVNVSAIAPVQQTPDTPKEQFSTNPTSKDVPKTPVKLPSRLHLNGKIKLTYELIDGDWYLVGLENLALKAMPLD